MNYLLDALGWIVDPAQWSTVNGIPFRIAEHLLITVLSVFLAALIALPLGVLIGHTRRGSAVIGAIAGAARAVPTLGILTLFGLMLGIGLSAPIFALIILAIPSMLAASYAGIQAVDQVTVSAAKAQGMNPAQIIFGVEVPLALPVIVGGIRASTLQVVATATLAAYTSDFGLGRYLFSGLKTRDYPQMLAGALLVVLLALLLELMMAWVQGQALLRVTDPARAAVKEPNLELNDESNHQPQLQTQLQTERN